MKGVDMALEMKCICKPYEEDSQEIASNYRFLTLEETVAIASGFSSCCAYTLHSTEFSIANPDVSYTIELWTQELHREVAGGGLPSVVDCLEPTKRLIPRRALELWLAERESIDVSGDDEANKSDSQKIRRAKAIAEMIKTQGYDQKAITIQQKTDLRELVRKQHPTLSFGKATFDKAWVEGGKLGLFEIKDKSKYDKARRAKKADSPK